MSKHTQRSRQKKVSSSNRISTDEKKPLNQNDITKYSKKNNTDHTENNSILDKVGYYWKLLTDSLTIKIAAIFEFLPIADVKAADCEVMKEHVLSNDHCFLLERSRISAGDWAMFSQCVKSPCTAIENAWKWFATDDSKIELSCTTLKVHSEGNQVVVTSEEGDELQFMRIIINKFFFYCGPNSPFIVSDNTNQQSFTSKANDLNLTPTIFDNPLVKGLSIALGLVAGGAAAILFSYLYYYYRPESSTNGNTELEDRGNSAGSDRLPTYSEATSGRPPYYSEATSEPPPYYGESTEVQTPLMGNAVQNSLTE